MTIDQYLAEKAFCRKCGQGLRENFSVVVQTEVLWLVRCARCTYQFEIRKTHLDTDAVDGTIEV